MPSKGWTADEALSSGIAPPASRIYKETFNLFYFSIELPKFLASSFMVKMPDMEVNDLLVPGKSISFELIQTRKYVDIFQALCS
jgi:hypothetical protein